MRPEYKALGDFGTLGLEIVLCILFGSYGGNWLDGKLHTAPWLLVIGFLFGCAAAGKGIHRSLGQMRAQAAREEKEEGNPEPMIDAKDQGSVRAADERRVKIKEARHGRP